MERALTEIRSGSFAQVFRPQSAAATRQQCFSPGAVWDSRIASWASGLVATVSIRTAVRALVLVAAVTMTTAPALAQPCGGDCNGDSAVTVNELVAGVNIALGAASLDACPSFDLDHSSSVEINELVAAVNNALCGCNDICATPAPLSTPTSVPTHTPQPTVAFANPSYIPVPGEPSSLAVADLDDDGNLDVIVGKSSFYRDSFPVSVLFGDGSGGFTPPIDLTAGQDPLSVAVADLNGDGHLDVVSGGYDRLSVFYGDGKRNFSSYFIRITGYWHSVVAGNFDARNGADFVAANLGSGYDPSETLLGLADGNGSFSLSTVPVGGGVFGLAAGDFNGDGVDDVAVAHSTIFDFVGQLFLGDGHGNLRAAASTSLPDLASQSREACGAVADVNLDGYLDLLFAGDGRVFVLLGDGRGGLGEPLLLPGIGYSVAVADFNGDGIPDVVGIAGQVTILLGQGAAEFTRTAAINTGSSPIAVATGDFNRDGRPDVVVADHFDRNIAILLTLP
jgi:hypothetical protein